jgi:hypothetical protein
LHSGLAGFIGRELFGAALAAVCVCVCVFLCVSASPTMRTHLCPLPVLQKGASWHRTCSVLFDDPTDEDSDTRNLSCARLSCNRVRVCAFLSVFSFGGWSHNSFVACNPRGYTLNTYVPDLLGRGPSSVRLPMHLAERGTQKAPCTCV